MTAAQIISLNPTAFQEALERRVVELWDLLHTATMELTVLRSELRLLRSGHKTALEIKAALIHAGDFRVAPSKVTVKPNHYGIPRRI